ncbi:DUF3891 family protein [Merismopedia glauca]|uniref:DUF3891 domain-containing protein n=1 Tax=Merismopedia glauca CCAP 1448/3 TaxID=1296344 RepID=A0A2T1C3Y4_9CYAN|nr:DUF3891 family protein [Merismopedia glauca]PSB02934.1 DUF3891 domain-containing protein [Merismopedia glauca CCAP 1448/3]
MIVNLQPDGWEIIYHRAHALLAAQIAGAWHLEDSAPSFIDTIAAISHHDDLEKEWEKNQLTPAGAPLDFTLEGQTSVKKLRQHIEDSLYRGRWVALLTSMHLCFINSQDQSATIQKFVKEQEDLQTQWREELEVKKEEAESAYRFMQWCDRLSLILCQNQLPDNERALEIDIGSDKQSYDVVQFNNGLITVNSWPFKADKFTVKVEASYLSQIKFENNTALKRALKTAPRKYRQWTFIKQNPQ